MWGITDLLILIKGRRRGKNQRSLSRTTNSASGSRCLQGGCIELLLSSESPFRRVAFSRHLWTRRRREEQEEKQTLDGDFLGPVAVSAWDDDGDGRNRPYRALPPTPIVVPLSLFCPSRIRVNDCEMAQSNTTLSPGSDFGDSGSEHMSLGGGGYVGGSTGGARRSPSGRSELYS